MLANGELGWLQMTNLILAGVLTGAFAIGLRRVLATGRAATWAPRLIACYGAGLVCAGIFRADPAQGFPPGTPLDAAGMSGAGVAHYAAAGIGFVCLVVATVLLARRFAAEGRRGWAACSAATGAVFALTWVAMVASGGASVALVGFAVGVVLVCAWIAALALHLLRRLP